MVPGTGVVFAEVSVDEGVGLGELVGKEEVELPEPLLRNEFKLGGPSGEVGAERFGGLSGCEGSGQGHVLTSLRRAAFMPFDGRLRPYSAIRLGAWT